MGVSRRLFDRGNGVLLVGCGLALHDRLPSGVDCVCVCVASEEAFPSASSGVGGATVLPSACKSCSCSRSDTLSLPRSRRTATRSGPADAMPRCCSREEEAEEKVWLRGGRARAHRCKLSNSFSISPNSMRSLRRCGGVSAMRVARAWRKMEITRKTNLPISTSHTAAGALALAA